MARLTNIYEASVALVGCLSKKIHFNLRIGKSPIHIPTVEVSDTRKAESQF